MACAAVDDQLVSMTLGATPDVHGLEPGPHTIRAAFVAVDHRPLSNRVVAAMLVQVGAP